MDSEDLLKINIKDAVRNVVFSVIALLLFSGLVFVHRHEIKIITSTSSVMVYKSVYIKK